jgi:hypothetical protein
MPVKKVPMSAIRRKYTKLPIDRKWIILALVVLAVSFVMKINVFPIIFLTLFCIANAIVLSIDRYVQAPLDLELSTFSAVLMTTRYGIQWGLAAAVLTKFAAIFYNKNVRVDHFFMIIGYLIAAVFANVFRGMPIILLGVIVTIIVNLYVVFISKYVTMISDYETLMYGLSNTIFNIVLFIGFSELFLGLMFA